MVLERFRGWIAGAPARARADAARALVAAYGETRTDAERRRHLDGMTALLLDDPSVAVRRALAEAAARSVDVPRAVAVALAQDDAPVAVPMLLASPLLGEADLIEAVAAGDGDAQAAVASRAGVAEAVAAALVEAGTGEAILALCRNGSARLTPAVLRRIQQRFGHEPEMREALLAHCGRDPALHHELVQATAQALTRFAVQCAWMSPGRATHLTRELRDQAAVTIASDCRARLGHDSVFHLVAHLRGRGHLTPALLLRGLLSGNRDLLEAALAHLTRTPASRVAGHMRVPNGLGFAALYARAALPPTLLPVFRAALQAVGEAAQAGWPLLSRPAVVRVLASCEGSGLPELERAAALLRRLEAESLRDAARLDPQSIDEPVRHPRAPDLATFQRPHAPPLQLRTAA